MAAVKARGKAIALSTAAVGVVVLMAARFAAWPWMRGQYYNYFQKLKSENWDARWTAFQELLATGISTKFLAWLGL